MTRLYMTHIYECVVSALYECVISMNASDLMHRRALTSRSESEQAIARATDKKRHTCVREGVRRNHTATDVYMCEREGERTRKSRREQESQRARVCVKGSTSPNRTSVDVCGGCECVRVCVCMCVHKKEKERE